MDVRHKRCAGVLGLAVAALLIDRLFLGPADASAAMSALSTAPPGAAEQTVGGEAAAPETVHVQSLEASIAGRLDAIAEARGLDGPLVPDAFRLPEGWIDTPAPPAEPTGEDFTRHQLQAALANGSESMALVDGVTVRIGDVYDGMRLVEVRPRAAVFQDDAGRTVELVLVDAPAAGR